MKKMHTHHDEPIFRLKISEKQKYARDGEWFKQYTDYLIPYETTVVDDYETMKLSYDLLNNNLLGFKRDLDKFCNPFGEEEQLSLYQQEEILPYNQIHNKVNIQAGELLKRNTEFKPVLISNKSIAAKNMEYKQFLHATVERNIAKRINVLQMQQNGASQAEIQQAVEQLQKDFTPENIDQANFLTDWEIFNTKALKYCHYSQDIKNKEQLCLRHASAADRMFTYVGWEFGEPVIKVINPLHCGYHKSPDVEYVQHGDYFWYKQAITIADVYNLYGDQLTEAQIDEIGVYNYSTSLRVNKNHSVLDNKAKKVFNTTTEEMFRHSQDIHDKSVGQAEGSGSARKYNNDRLVWKTHIEFRAFRELIFLSYPNEYGEMVTEIVDKSFDIPKEATKIKFTNKFGKSGIKYEWVDDLLQIPYTAEVMWIPRRYEATRLGQDIYVDYREVPDQPLNLENPYKHFELSYKGRVFTNVNSKSISPVQRATPYQFQYFFVKAIQNRELAKYQGFAIDVDTDQIPDYLGKDENGDPIPGRDPVAMWRLYLKKMGINFYSGSQSADGLPPSTRSPGSKSSMMGTAAELLNLARLLEVLDNEIGMAMGISPQREAQISSNSNVSDNQQAIAQSYTITEPFFFMMSEVWRHSINEWLKLFKMYCQKIFEAEPEKKEHFLHYVTPDGTPEMLRITPDLLQNEDVGLFISNSGNDEIYRKMMTQMSHAFSQNAGEGMIEVSTILRAITSGQSSAEIHKLIELTSRKQQERMMANQEAEMKRQQQMAMVAKEDREDKQAHEVELQEKKYDREEILAVIRDFAFQEDLNKDKDGIPDPLEAAQIGHQMLMDRKTSSQKDRELDIKEKEAANKAAAEAQKAKEKNKPTK